MEHLLFEIFESLPRQGPGDRESTKRAFLATVGLPDNPEILDVGCGVGMQTLDLANLTSGRITAVDNHTPFLTKLQKKAKVCNCRAEIRTALGDMAALDFPPDSFDLIWSEGAAYNIGFENALKTWRSLLRSEGCMAISEVAWLKKNPPQEVQSFWADEYPDIKYDNDNIATIEASGYKVLNYFTLPDESWWTCYYHPIEQKLHEMRATYQGNAEAQEIFDSFQVEIDMHRKYSDYYGYEFYIMKRID